MVHREAAASEPRPAAGGRINLAAVVATIAASIATGSTVRHQQPARSNFPQCPKTVD